MEALRQGVQKATISPVVKDNAIHIPCHATFTVPKAQRNLNARFGHPSSPPSTATFATVMATTTQVTTATMSSFLKDKSSTIQATPLTDIPNVPFLP